MIVGIDEVGRGPWAGPLVFSAVILGGPIEGLTDSKKLTAKKREQLYDEITSSALAVGIGWVHSDELDVLGLGKALTECCLRALRDIQVPFHEIILDGTVNVLKGTALERHVTTLKKADLLIPSVSAASIVAKVTRDRFMAEQDAKYPGYGFMTNVGYGTASHASAIESQGLTPLHRRSFAPIAAYAAQKPPTTKSIGDRGEDAACDELVRRKYQIVERNWRTKYCEIDIVARKADTLYFVEVKHRKSTTHGGGLGAITAKKLQQMKFAAEYYQHMHKFSGPVQLAAVVTEGTEASVTDVLLITE